MAETVEFTILDILQRDSAKPASELLSLDDLKAKWSFMTEDALSFIEDDYLTVKGENRKIKRVYVRHKDKEDDGVGSVLNECMSDCMNCSQEFGPFRWQHHCRACKYDVPVV